MKYNHVRVKESRHSLSRLKGHQSGFSTFGDLLKFLRRRVQLSQRELSIAVGYSESQISRLETNQRPPDPTSILALFVPALGIEDDPELIDRLIELSKESRAGSVERTAIQDTPAPKLSSISLPPVMANQMVSLPTGIVTFMFSDIEGSTQLWEMRPEAMRESVAQHHDILRRAIEAHNGRIFKVVGDAFQAVFIEPRHALQAALAAQRGLRDASWNETGPLKVRIGLHTGEAELDLGSDEYAVSHTKNRVARVMSAGYGGQVLLSEETANLVKRSLPGDIELKDLGEHRLKGMEKLEHLFQVVVHDLLEFFPPLTSQQALRNHMPIQLTTFIGREEELTELCDLLRSNETRLVALTGEGGCGKTRLALRAGEDLAQDYEHGAWLVELASLTEPGLVMKTTAAVFGLRDSGKDPYDQLVEFLQPKKTLLILDNCEHLVEAVSRLAEGLLRSCPELCLMATSRETLNVPGEMIFRVLPLALPPNKPGNSATAQEIERYDAIQLFTERARSVQRGFMLNNQNAAAVARICQQLDGIPLAIELAAVRVNLLSPAQIASRLEADLEVLSPGRRFGPSHQQTLYATIDWSYNLLNEFERVLLRRLSVFSGGWTLEAAEDVASREPIYRKLVVDLLAGLVNKSLVYAVNQEDGTYRYSLLETVRICLRQKLEHSGELEEMQDRHTVNFLRMAETTEPYLTTREQVIWLVRLERDNDNLRAALSWCVESQQVETGLRLAGALWRYWWITAALVEGVRWCQSILQIADEAPDLKRTHWYAQALFAYGFLLDFSSQSAEAARILEQSAQLFRSLNDAAGSGAALCMLGVTQFGMNIDRAISLLEEGLVYSYQAEDGWWIAFNKH